MKDFRKESTKKRVINDETINVESKKHKIDEVENSSSESQNQPTNERLVDLLLQQKTSYRILYFVFVMKTCHDGIYVSLADVCTAHSRMLYVKNKLESMLPRGSDVNVCFVDLKKDMNIISQFTTDGTKTPLLYFGFTLKKTNGKPFINQIIVYQTNNGQQNGVIQKVEEWAEVQLKDPCFPLKNIYHNQESMFNTVKDLYQTRVGKIVAFQKGYIRVMPRPSSSGKGIECSESEIKTIHDLASDCIIKNTLQRATLLASNTTVPDKVLKFFGDKELLPCSIDRSVECGSRFILAADFLKGSLTDMYTFLSTKNRKEIKEVAIEYLRDSMKNYESNPLGEHFHKPEEISNAISMFFKHKCDKAQTENQSLDSFDGIDDSDCDDDNCGVDGNCYFFYSLHDLLDTDYDNSDDEDFDPDLSIRYQRVYMRNDSFEWISDTNGTDNDTVSNDEENSDGLPYYTVGGITSYKDFLLDKFPIASDVLISGWIGMEAPYMLYCINGAGEVINNSIPTVIKIHTHTYIMDGCKHTAVSGLPVAVQTRFSHPALKPKRSIRIYTNRSQGKAGNTSGRPVNLRIEVP